jgi:signal transduction histidine kinase
MSDKNLVQELISIMMDNAVKYCDEGGEVRAVLSHRGKRVKLRFLNNYSAGADADYSRFFDRFYRADQSHNSAKKGFGIGLSMAQEIVSTLKGKISVGWKDGIIMFTIIL